MAIINVNGISGINSITAQSGSLNFYTAAGNNLPISAGALNVGTGASISSPATNVLALGTNNIEAVRITSTGQLQATGAADVRLTLGSGGTAGTNDSVHIRADGANLKFMNASGGVTIFEQNGTERVRIDSSGRVTMPYQPFVFVTRSGNVSFASGSKIPYDSALDSRNLTWNTTNNNFVVPVTGVYTFSIYIRLEITNANYIYAQIRSNGSFLYNSSVLYLQKPNTLSTFQTVGVTISVKLTQNDTVDVTSNWDGTSPATLYALQSSMSIVFNG